MLYKNKACTTIEIEMPEDEEFDPNKATIVGRGFKYPDDDIDPTVCAFGYDGKVYDCAPGDSNGISGEKIWPYDLDAKKENDDDWGGWDDEEPEEDDEDFAEESQPENEGRNYPANRDMEYIKTLEIYANEVDPYDEEDEESYYESWFKIGENYCNVSLI